MRLIDADVVEQIIRNAWINNIIGFSEMNILKDLLKGASIIEAEPVRKGNKFCPRCGAKMESVEDEELL